MNSSFFKQEITCPVCQTNFTVTRVRSSAFRVQRRDTDFCITYEGPDPNVYNIWVCPKCLFAASLRTFNEEMRPTELERLVKGLALLKTEEPDFSGERDLKLGLRSYELAIRTAQIRQLGPGFQAALFLRAAWICRHLKDQQLELQYLEQARQLYEQSYNIESPAANKMSEPALMYIVGELNRRTGKYNEAIKWFSRGINHPKIDQEPEIKRLMREQWQLAKEQFNTFGEGNSPDPQQADPSAADTTEDQAPEPAKRKRPRSKLFAALYNDQIEWLQKIANKNYDSKGILLERELILRSVLDAVMALEPELDNISSEDELTQKLLEQIEAKKKA